MKAVVAAFNQKKALVGAFSVITNLRIDFFEALEVTLGCRHTLPPDVGLVGAGRGRGREGRPALLLAEAEHAGGGAGRGGGGQRHRALGGGGAVRNLQVHIQTLDW